MFRNLGYVLRLLRELKGLSQQEVARKGGIGKSQVSLYESGRVLPRLESLEKFLKVLDTDLSHLAAILSFVDQAASNGARLPSAPSPRLVAMLGITAAMDGALEAFASAQIFLLKLRELAWEVALDEPTRAA